jgi:hypothetical protein
VATPNLRSSGDLHRQGTWAARLCGSSSASRPKRLAGGGRLAQTLRLCNKSKILQASNDQRDSTSQIAL